MVLFCSQNFCIKFWLQNKKLLVKSAEFRVKVTFLAALEKYFIK